MVLVDTSVWSEILRRREGHGRKEIIQPLADLIGQGLACLIGSIRQEILSGIRDRGSFEEVRIKLRGISEFPVQTEDYESAAKLYNACREKGIQGSHVDMLICAVAINQKFSVFTLDQDFEHYAKAVPIHLYRWGKFSA